MSRVALAEVGDQFAEAGKRPGPRLVGNEVGLQGRVFLHPLDESVELGSLGGIVERRWIQAGRWSAWRAGLCLAATSNPSTGTQVKL